MRRIPINNSPTPPKHYVKMPSGCECVRRSQVLQLLSCIDQICDIYKRMGKTPAVLVTGDLNTIAGAQVELIWIIFIARILSITHAHMFICVLPSLSPFLILFLLLPTPTYRASVLCVTMPSKAMNWG